MNEQKSVYFCETHKTRAENWFSFIKTACRENTENVADIFEKNALEQNGLRPIRNSTFSNNTNKRNIFTRSF